MTAALTSNRVAAAVAAGRPVRAVKYRRISSDPSGERFGVETQDQEIDYRLAREGWELAGEYEDNDTGAYKENVKRPGFDQMMADAAAGKFDVIVARHMDRLTRRDDAWAVIKKRCMDLGVVIVTTADGVDTSTDAGRMVAGMLANVAEFEMERKKYRHLTANVRRAEQGTGWGPKAFGYNGDHANPALVPAEAKAVREAYHSIKAGGTMYSVWVKWNKAGFRTNKGNEWTNVALKRLLLNPRYAGLRSYNREILYKDGEPVKGTWPAIVDMGTWEAVRYILTNSPHKAVNARKYLLGGILTCSECGKGLVSGNTNDHRAATEEDRPIYKCGNPLCYRVYRRQRLVDPWVETAILKRIREKGWKLVSEVDPDQVEALHNEAITLRTRLDSLGADYADGNLTAGQVKVATEKLQTQLREVEAQLARLAKSEVFDGLIGADDLVERWEGLPLDRQRSVIKALVENVEVAPVGVKGRAASKLPLGHNIKIHWRKAEEG